MRDVEVRIQARAVGHASSRELTRRQKLELCLKKIFHSEGVPPFSEHASELMLRALDPEARSSELARIIVKDLGLSSQILRLANSAWYNRSGRPVLSLAHAVMLLGWDMVRNLVSTVPYVEHFVSRSPGLRQLMLVSVLTAEHSRRIASVIGYPNPDEAHLCGLFANLGEVLIACHYGREYSEIILNMHGEKIPAGAACMRVLDFTWQEVGLQVASGWNMPGKIVHCLGGRSGSGTERLDRCLASVTTYAHDLTHALYRDGIGIDAVHLRCILDPDGQKSLISVRDLRKIVDTALVDAEKKFYALQIPTQTLRLDQQAAEAVKVLDSVPVFDPVAIKTLDHVIDAANRAIHQDHFDLSTVISGLLNALQATGFDHVVFGLMNEQHTAIRGRIAASVDDIAGRFLLAMSDGNAALVSALDSKQDVIADRSRESRYYDSALIEALNAQAFALFSIVIDHRIAGCLYADIRSRCTGMEGMRSALGRVRNTIAAAIRAKAQANKR